MEEDVVGACVENAFTQGCEHVYLVDNNSADDTVEVAVAAGATPAATFSTPYFDEHLRMSIMQSVVEQASRSVAEDSVWWLWLDADEFPHGPGGMTIRELLATLDVRFRVVGARYFNHYPTVRPYYVPGFHPLDFQPECEEYSVGWNCAGNHHKHPLLRADRDAPRIVPTDGFHSARADVQVLEPDRAVFVHHFPYRAEATTRRRLDLLCRAARRRRFPHLVSRPVPIRSRVELHASPPQHRCGVRGSMGRRARAAGKPAVERRTAAVAGARPGRRRPVCALVRRRRSRRGNRRETAVPVGISGRDVATDRLRLWPRSRRAGWTLAAILLVCLAARLGWVLHLTSADPAATRSPDTPSYVVPAKSLLDHGRFDAASNPGEPMFLRTPGYPVFIATVYAVFGRHETAVLVAQVLLSVLTLWVAFVVAARLFGEAAGIVSAAVLGLDPLQFRTSGTLLTETLDGLALLLVVALAFRALSSARSGAGWPFLLGTALVAATFVRPTTYYACILLVLLLAVLWLRSRTRQRLTVLVACAVPLVIGLGAWQVRNDENVGSWRFSGTEAYTLYYYHGAGVLARVHGTDVETERARLRRELGRAVAVRRARTSLACSVAVSTSRLHIHCRRSPVTSRASVGRSPARVPRRSHGSSESDRRGLSRSHWVRGWPRSGSPSGPECGTRCAVIEADGSVTRSRSGSSSTSSLRRPALRRSRASALRSQPCSRCMPASAQSTSGDVSRAAATSRRQRGEREPGTDVRPPSAPDEQTENPDGTGPAESPRLRVLFAISRLDRRGGASVSVAEHAIGLREAGVDTEVAVFERAADGLEPLLEHAGVPVHVLGAAHLRTGVPRLRRLLRERRPDILHTTLWAADQAGRLAAWGTPTLVVSSIVNPSREPIVLLGDSRPAWRRRAMWWFDGWTARHLTAGLHAITVATKASAVRGLRVPPERVTVVLRSRDPARLGLASDERRRSVRRALDLVADADIVLNVARQEPQKGQAHLVDAFARLVEAHPNARLLIAGAEGSSTPVLEARVRAHGLGGRVRLLGHRDDVGDLLAAADVFAFPSVFEGLGAALIEAMALGVPIVASDLPAVREVTAGGDVALLVPAGDPDTLAGRATADARRPHARGRLRGSWPDPLPRDLHTAALGCRTHRPLSRGAARARCGDGVSAPSDPTGRPRARVLLLVKGLGPGGAERLLLAAAAGRDRARFDYEVAYLLPWKTALVPDFERVGVPVHCLDVRDERDPRWAGRLRRLLRDGHFDVVHSHSPYPAGVARLVALTFRRSARPRLVTTEHNAWPTYTPATRVFNRLTAPLDAARIAVSDHVGESIRGRTRNRTEVVVHGIALEDTRHARCERDAVRAELGFSPESIVVGTIANYMPQKDYPNLFAAARVLVDQNPGLRFCVVGQGPLERDIEASRHEMGLDDVVVLTGLRHDAVRLMAGCDIFVLASRYEGLPVAIMEALALGLPIVATAVGGVPQAVRDGIEGFLVPPQPRRSPGRRGAAPRRR